MIRAIVADDIVRMGRQVLRMGPGGIAFGVAIGAVATSALILWAAGESEWPMFALCLGGIGVGWMLGLPERHLTVIAFAVLAIAWPTAMLSSPIPRATSTLAHVALAALVAWVIAGPIRHRWPATSAPRWSPRWFAIPALVVVIGGAWELGEWTADALFETDLAVRPLDTVGDLAADLVGAVAGVALRDRLRGRSQEGR